MSEQQREFWIHGHYAYESPTYETDGHIHVIEYSAFAAMRAAKMSRDIYCDQIEKEMSREIRDLRKECDDYRAALEFYANGAHWSTHDHEDLFNNVSDSDWMKNENGCFVGGKTANEVLAKYPKVGL